MVLFVDDEEGILNSLKRLFRKEPYLVRFLSSGKEALELLSHLEDVAVIVSDQRMPGMGGTEFLIRSRELAPEATRMLITGYSDFQATIEAMNDGGVTRYISKPWDDLQLLEAVRDAVADYHRRMSEKSELNKVRQQLEEEARKRSELARQQTAQLEQQLERVCRHSLGQMANYRILVESLAGLADMKTQISRRHAANTAFISVSVARAMGLVTDHVEDIRLAALLHDIGKNALSDDLLNSGLDGMTETQLALFKSHPAVGQSMIEVVDELKSIAIMVRHHHERFDGTGFPDGLSGSDIPVGAAIIALANSLDSEMGFQHGKAAVETVLEQLSKRIGTEFDPVIFPYVKAPALELYGGQQITVQD